MSGTTKVRLSEKQLAWARAFMRATGMKGELAADVVGESGSTALKGSLGHREERVDSRLGASLKSDKDIKGVGEKVGRKVFGAGKGYKTDVVQKIDALIKQADQLVSAGTVGSEVGKLIASLREARDGYEQREQGETNKSKLDQRQRKVQAIDRRMKALQGLLDDAEVSRLDDLNYMGDEQRLKELVANPAILGSLVQSGLDRTTAEAAMKKLRKENPKAFGSQPGIFGAFVGMKPPKGKIVKVLEAVDGADADKLVSEVLKVDGGSPDEMNELCQAAVLAEGSKGGSTGTFFRGNSVATKLTKAFAVSGDESKAFLADIATERDKAFVGMPEQIEIDPAKIKPKPGEDPEAIAEASVRYIEKTCDDLLKALYAMDVPANVATTASMIAGAAESRDLSDEEIAIMVGGHLLLRIINPLLTTAKKPGDKALAANEQRLTMLVTKVIQNISNHIVKADPNKEAFMAHMVAYQRKAIPAMDRWCAHVVEIGDEILNG